MGCSEVSLVFDGEGSYQRSNPTSYNRFATCFYRSFNYSQYRRTADVNRLIYHGVNLDPAATAPWSSIETTDYPKEQSWSRGDLFNCCCWFSCMSHYRENLPWASWEVESGGAPVIWLATCNHMMSESNAANAGVRFPGGHRRWGGESHPYPCFLGSRAYADAWAEQPEHVAVKPNLCYCLRCWFSRSRRFPPEQGLLEDPSGNTISQA